MVTFSTGSLFTKNCLYGGYIILYSLARTPIIKCCIIYQFYTYLNIILYSDKTFQLICIYPALQQFIMRLIYLIPIL